MKFTAETIREAWKIRKEAAKKLALKIMDVSWEMCLLLASTNNTMESNNMKKIIAVSIMALAMSACSSSPEDKIKEKMDQMHPLSSEEMLKAENSAKQFFNKEFPSVAGTMRKGSFQECRPSDSNFNGLVTCMGYIPNQANETMVLVTRYCTYRADMVMGCSNEDK